MNARRSDPITKGLHHLKHVTKMQHVTKTSSGWLARSPSHDDHSPGLSVGQAKDGTVLLKCLPESRPSAPTVAVTPPYFRPDEELKSADPSPHGSASPSTDQPDPEEELT